MSNMQNFKNILLVENSNDNRESLIELFSLSGYSVIDSDNHEAGYNLAIIQEPDLILLDSKGFDNCHCLDTIKLIKSVSTCSDIPVVILSTNSSSVYRSNCYDAGADLFLLKPFTFEHLLSKIKGFCNISETFSAA